MKKKDIKLFGTAFMQVLFVSANIYFVSNSMWVAVAVTSFLISYLWTINVKKIAISNIIDRLIYSTGAMVGGVAGPLMAHVIKMII